MKTNKVILLTVVVTLVLCSCTTPKEASEPTDADELSFAQGLQNALDLSLRMSNGTGISAAVYVEGEGTWMGVSGISEPSQPISPDMQFDIASTGKNFVAVLILQLVEEGILSLDDPISRWLADYRNIDNAITIRQLLNHTSGIFDWVEHPQSPFRRSFIGIDFEEESSPERVVATLVGEPYFPPGDGFRYSTTNYTLLRMIVEQATGSTVAEQIQERFLDPLNLHCFILDSAMPFPEDAQIAHAWWDVDRNGTLDDVTSRPVTWIATRSPALMYCSAADLVRWSQALYGGEILRQDRLEQVLTFHRPTPTAPGEPFSTGYGLGTQELHLAGEEIWGHLGWQYGYTSSMLYFPAHSASIVVLINDNNMMLINLASIMLWIVVEFHIAPVRFVLVLGSAMFLLSMFLFWPINWVSMVLRKRKARAATVTPAKSRTARIIRWAAILTGITMLAAIVVYLGYSMNPITTLRWAHGTPLAKIYIALSIFCAISAISLIYPAVLAWKDRLWSFGWRLHYSVVVVASLIMAYTLLGLLF